MRYLQEAIEVGCRAIEAFMRDRGEQMSFHMHEFNMNRDANHAPTDFAGNSYETGAGVTQINLSILGVHLGSIAPDKNEERMALKAKLTKSGTPATPDVVADIPDAGYRAGVRALLDKFQTAIKNATEIAEGADVPSHLRHLTTQAHTVRPDDIAAKLLRAVLDLQDERRTAYESEMRMRKELELNPEKQLQQRLKMKMKTNYLEQGDVLREFQNFILDHYSAHFPDARPDAVPAFLEQVGDDG